MKKISPSEKNLLMILSGVFIVIIFYMYVFTPLQDINNNMKQSVDSIGRQVQELEIHSQYIATYQEKT